LSFSFSWKAKLNSLYFSALFLVVEELIRYELSFYNPFKSVISIF